VSTSRVVWGKMTVACDAEHAKAGKRVGHGLTRGRRSPSFTVFAAVAPLFLAQRVPGLVRRVGGRPNQISPAVLFCCCCVVLYCIVFTIIFVPPTTTGITSCLYLVPLRLFKANSKGVGAVVLLYCTAHRSVHTGSYLLAKEPPPSLRFQEIILSLFLLQSNRQEICVASGT